MFSLLLTAGLCGPVEVPVCVARLGDDRYFVREAAARRLELIGPPALETLKGALGDGDRERVRRAERVIAAIRRRADESGSSDADGHGPGLARRQFPPVRH
jgi:hypothetical protein